MKLFKNIFHAIRNTLSKHFYFRATPTILLFIAFAIIFTWACGAPPSEDYYADLADNSASTTEDTFINIFVTINDSFYNSLQSLAVTTNAEHGATLAVTDDGYYVRYTPNIGYTGSDQFTYELCVEDSICDTAVVTVTVAPVERGGETEEAPDPVAEAVDDTMSTDEDTAVTSTTLLDNDTVTPSVFSFEIDTDPGDGEVTLAATGLTYTPDTGFSGTDTFTYEVCAAEGICDTATVTVTVTASEEEEEPEKPAPVAVDDEASTNAGVPVDIDLTGNDTHADGTIDDTSITIVTAPSGGTLADNGDGTVTYSPNAYFTGDDTFTYTVDDALGKTSNEADVFIEVKYTNQPPQAVNDTATCAINQSVVIEVLKNDSDPNDFILPGSVTISSGPSFGSVLINTQTGTVTYTPNSGYNGTDSFIYYVTDGWGASSNQAQVNITIPITCGDDYCSYPPETTTTCDDDCHCINDGVCNSPVEGDNCPDCGSAPPTTCNSGMDQASCEAHGGAWGESECVCCGNAQNQPTCENATYNDWCSWNYDTSTCVPMSEG